jgi:tetrahydromethanopterin S-methyltransferase subunit B
MKKKSSDTTVIDAALRAQLRALMMPGIARKLDELLRVIGELNPSRSDSAGRDPAWPGREGAARTAVA